MRVSVWAGNGNDFQMPQCLHSQYSDFTDRLIPPGEKKERMRREGKTVKTCPRPTFIDFP